MATAYGGYYTGAGYNAFRARMDYSTSASTDTSATIQVVVKCQMGSGHDSGGNFRGTANINGSTSSWTGSSYYSAGGTYTMGTKTLSITKTHSAQSITVKATVTSTYAWSGHSSTASATVSVPAKKSYNITYNANTGSGEPGSQTKWYGETLKLSTTVPKLDGYDFMGWSITQSSPGSGEVKYAAGGSYEDNAAATLYAVWKRAYIPPKISALSVYRASDTIGTASDEGKYCYVKCTWSVDISLTSGNKGKTLAIEYKAASATSWTSAKSVSLSKTSDTTSTAVLNSSSAGITFDTSTTYHIRVTVSDMSNQTGNTASATSTLSPAFYTLDFGNQGHNIGIGHAADLDYGVDVGIKLRCDNVNFEILDSDIPPAGTDPSGDVTVWGNGLYMYPSIAAGETDQELAVGYIRAMHRGDGAWNPRARGIQIEAQRGTGTNRKTNALNLLLDNSGNATVEMTQAAAWRKALGETDWANLPLGSNAQSYSDSWLPKYKRHIGSLVTIRGAVKPKSQVAAGNDLLIGTLPTGFRPSSESTTICQGSGGAIFMLAVYDDGKVQCERYRNGSTNAAIPTTAWVVFSFTFAL